MPGGLPEQDHQEYRNLITGNIAGWGTISPTGEQPMGYYVLE